jgi:uncharacterized protein (DUF1810 family)
VSDPWDLARFVEAQTDSFERARAELAAGRKSSHWIWFVFPQLRGLGTSPMAERYGISGRAEAEAYLRHPLLGARLVDCTRLVTSVAGDLRTIFGSPDDLKFVSSMTLFDAVESGGSVFAEALDRHAAGVRDAATIRLLDGA